MRLIQSWGLSGLKAGDIVGRRGGVGWSICTRYVELCQDNVAQAKRHFETAVWMPC